MELGQEAYSSFNSKIVTENYYSSFLFILYACVFAVGDVLIIKISETVI